VNHKGLMPFLSSQLRVTINFFFALSNCFIHNFYPCLDVASHNLIIFLKLFQSDGKWLLPSAFVAGLRSKLHGLFLAHTFLTKWGWDDDELRLINHRLTCLPHQRNGWQLALGYKKISVSFWCYSKNVYTMLGGSSSDVECMMCCLPLDIP